MNDGRLDPFIMFFYTFLLFTFIRWVRIRLGIKQNGNETENWLEKRSTPFFPPAPVTSPPKRKCPDIPVPFRRICLSGKKFMPTVVNPQHWKQSLLPFLFCHARIASGEIIFLTDNELLAFTWGSRQVKTERPYQFWSHIFTSFPSTIEHLPRRSTTLAELADDLSHGFVI